MGAGHCDLRGRDLIARTKPSVSKGAADMKRVLASHNQTSRAKGAGSCKLIEYEVNLRTLRELQKNVQSECWSPSRNLINSASVNCLFLHEMVEP